MRIATIAAAELCAACARRDATVQAADCATDDVGQRVTLTAILKSPAADCSDSAYWTAEPREDDYPE
jgi:hypothetical protein